MARESSVANVRTTVSGIPWLSEYMLGAGVDILESALKASPFEPASVKPEMSGGGARKTTDYSLITDTKDLKKYLDVSSNVSAGLPFGISASVGMEFVSNVECSETSVTLIFKSESIYNEYDRIRPIFTSEAKKILRNDPNRFRRMYGDYYVAGSKKGSSFVALFVLSSSCSSTMTSLRTDANFAKGICSVTSKTEVGDSRVSKNVKISAYMYTSGIKADADFPPMAESVEDVRNAYTKYLESIQYSNSKALLVHYHLEDPCYLPTIGIEPNALEEIQKLVAQIRLHRHTLEKVHYNYRSDVCSKLDQLTRTVEAHNLVSHGEKGAELFEEARSIQGLIDDIASRKEFYETVVKEQKKEELGTFSAAEKKYGITRGETVAKKSMSIRVKKGTTPKEIEVGERDRLIVGWSVSRQRETGKWKVPDQLLLRNTGKVVFESAGWWEVTVWSVEAQDYNFTV